MRSGLTEVTHGELDRSNRFLGLLDEQDSKRSNDHVPYYLK